MSKSTNTSPGKIAAFWMETARIMQKRIFCAAEEDSINPLQLYALYLIADHDKMTMKDLAGHLSITSPSATSLVERLVKLRWVKRVSDPKNRRTVRLTVLKEGRETLQIQMAKREKAMKDIIGLLSKEDQELFEHLLHSLHHALLSQKSIH